MKTRKESKREKELEVLKKEEMISAYGGKAGKILWIGGKIVVIYD